jgi:hypothetical protein
MSTAKVKSVHMSKPLKLEIELVPMALWGINLRTALTPTRWKRIRADAVAAGICEVCGSRDATKLHGHERWSYGEEYDDGAEGIAHLLGVGAVCHACHAVMHIGATQFIAAGNPLYTDMVDDAVKHFCKVNGLNRRVFEDHSRAVGSVHAIRNSMTWTVDWGAYRAEVEEVRTMRAAREASKRT